MICLDNRMRNFNDSFYHLHLLLIGWKKIKFHDFPFIDEHLEKMLSTVSLLFFFGGVWREITSFRVLDHSLIVKFLTITQRKKMNQFSLNSKWITKTSQIILDIHWHEWATHGWMYELNENDKIIIIHCSWIVIRI